MGGASAAITRVRQGQVVTLRPRGQSMAGTVDGSDLVTVAPLGERELRVGDVVLVRMLGSGPLPLIQAIPRKYGPPIPRSSGAS